MKTAQISNEMAADIIRSKVDFTIVDSVLRLLKTWNTQDDLQKAIEQGMSERELELSDHVFTIVQRKDSIDADDIIALFKDFSTTFKAVMPHFEDSLIALTAFSSQTEQSPDCILKDDFYQLIVTRFLRDKRTQFVSPRRLAKLIDSPGDSRSIFSNQDKLQIRQFDFV